MNLSTWGAQELLVVGLMHCVCWGVGGWVEGGCVCGYLGCRVYTAVAVVVLHNKQCARV